MFCLASSDRQSIFCVRYRSFLPSLDAEYFTVHLCAKALTSSLALSVSSSSVTLSVSPNPNASDSLDELEAAEWWASAVPKGVAERLGVDDDARYEGRRRGAHFVVSFKVTTVSAITCKDQQL